MKSHSNSGVDCDSIASSLLGTYEFLQNTDAQATGWYYLVLKKEQHFEGERAQAQGHTKSQAKLSKKEQHSRRCEAVAGAGLGTGMKAWTCSHQKMGRSVPALPICSAAVRG